MEFKTYEQLQADIAIVKSNFEQFKKEQIDELELKKLELFDTLKGQITTPEAMIEASKQISDIENQIQKIKVSTSDELKPERVVYFNGNFYKESKDVITRNKTVGAKFQIGENVKLYFQGIESEIYVVTENGKVKDSNNKLFDSSVLTRNFHTNTLGKPFTGRSMAGLSHPYWVKAN